VLINVLLDQFLNTKVSQGSVASEEEAGTSIHKKSVHCQLSRDQQIRSNQPCKPGESYKQLVQGDSD